MSEGISNDEECESAVMILRELKTAAGSISDQLETCGKKAHEAHKAITGKRKQLAQPYLDAENLLRKMTDSYVTARAKEARDIG